MGLVLLFNAYMVHRQWECRRLRKQLTQQITGTTDPQALADEIGEPSELDPVTGLYSRRSAEQRVAKEIARCRRENKPLTLLVLDLNDFGQLNDQYGRAASDLILKEFAYRLRKASRGSDFAVRLGSDEFLLVLPECGIGSVKHVVDRLNLVEVSCGGQKVSLTCSSGWIQYEPGELPTELLKRAENVLQLYRKAGETSSSPTLVN
jgi:diguanylate cyclase (GGDEF)-like protein